MSFVILAQVKPLEEITNPWTFDIELAGQEILIDVDLNTLITFEGEYSIWVKTFEGEEYAISKCYLHKFEIIDWGVDVEK